MRTGHLLTALATASLIVGGQALAQGRGGGHGKGGVGVGVGGQRIDTRIDTRVNTGIETRSQARARSRGPARANARARVRANENSVLHDPSLPPPDLSLLETGLEVRDMAGARVGTIARINRTGDGTIRNVLIRDLDGRNRTLPVAPGTLAIDGGIVTTTAVVVDPDVD